MRFKIQRSIYKLSIFVVERKALMLRDPFKGQSLLLDDVKSCCILQVWCCSDSRTPDTKSLDLEKDLLIELVVLHPDKLFVSLKLNILCEYCAVLCFVIDRQLQSLQELLCSVEFLNWSAVVILRALFDSSSVVGGLLECLELYLVVFVRCWIF